MRAHGVVVSHPLRMRKALGSKPSGSTSGGWGGKFGQIEEIEEIKEMSCAECKRFANRSSKKKAVDTLGFEPRAFRMRSGCDTTTPCALYV